MAKLKKQRFKNQIKKFGYELLSFSWIDGWYERLMRNERSVKVLAVLIVGIIYVSTTFVTPVSFSYAEDIRGKALTAIYDTENYVVEGLPKTVDFTLEGKEALVKSIVQTNTFKAIVDLSQLKPGQHIVNIDYDVIPSQIQVTSHPKTVSVLIKEVASQTYPIYLEYYNESLKNPLIELQSPQLSEASVNVKGAKDKVEQVVTVKGMIDVSDPSKLQDLTVDLFAVDKQGNKVEVELQPSQVKVTVPYSVPQKDVLIDLRFEDEFPQGKLLKASEVQPSKIKVYAPTKQLEALNVIFLTMKASEIKESGEYDVDVPVPEGVTKIEQTKVKVKIEIEDEISKVIKDVPVQVKGLGKGLKVTEDLKMTVTLRGSEQALAALNPDQIYLSVDLTDLSPGTHEQEVVLEKALPDQLKIEKLKPIQVRITN